MLDHEIPGVIQDSNFSTYQRMWSFMDSAKPTVFTTSNVEGVERVIKGKGSYAFLMESTSIEYVIERNCDLTQVGGLLDSKGYGIAMPPSKCTPDRNPPPRAHVNTRRNINSSPRCTVNRLRLPEWLSRAIESRALFRPIDELYP